MTKVTLEFDNSNSADRFIAWWLDGGGEQDGNYATTEFCLKKRYLRLKDTLEKDGSDED